MKRNVCVALLLIGWSGPYGLLASEDHVPPLEHHAPVSEDHMPTPVSALDFRQTVRHAKGRVFPAVVFVRCIRESFDAGKKQAQEISGSGVIISPQGEMLTNWHVVDKAVNIRCLLSSGEAYAAKLVGSDKDTDLALLKLELPAGVNEVPFAVIGDSDLLEEGDFVMAMGAPWGMSRSVAIGIISCTRRYLPDSSEYSLWLQTDCAISPGNSGGPLVNTEGEVIGINSRGFMMGGDLAFAVPSNTVTFIVQQLRAHGTVKWSWTGVQLQPLRDFNRNTYFTGSNGVMVAGTDRESPARQAGFLPRDRILSVNGVPANAITDEALPHLRALLGQLPIDESASFTILRGDEERIIELVPRDKGKVEGEEYDCKRWDMTVKTINQFDNPALHFHRSEGVFIYSIKRRGNASTAGLRSQDIITHLDNREVRTLDDVRLIHEDAIQAVDAKHRIIITVLRNGLVRQIVLDFLRDYEKE
jgi:serine protease Do